MEDIYTMIAIHKDQTIIVNNLWTVFQAVAIAILGYVFSQEYVRKSPWILGFLTIFFLFFSVANQRAISRSQELIVAAANELSRRDLIAHSHDPLSAVLRVYDAVEVGTLETGHRLLSLFVVAAIWVVFAVSRSKARNANAPA